MKIEQQFSDPEHVKDRQPYRVRIEGKDGQTIEITEQFGGGFAITAAHVPQRIFVLRPIDMHTIIIKVAAP